ncbi:histone acetyltransferase type B catalytic subunit-like protein [Dinothrombium tinctorium]|uniref:Histone acetyltransferase type B catalytic subunit n=1 Tax=Dinothrombium tinctorium TaxID=1965070 RepID=A0A3S3S2D7_9ACAR|nr:histone acetyltransferase type B catalytic subunit-like protein [Dinothrombium tinctorium]RWS09236.1 histone acetyltransferase type B catalytic subunit-like protein [Dinothrombium tinctorium]RWS09484.1 histone acetyltransferase type B catalytic subunit-like protein [Dinothrombium tinctorium]RWS09494.1 histone acetyltransferase type B catalytic subunit-like protein [Dinothrombium tinctorium]
MERSSLSRRYLEEFVCKANEVVFFKLIASVRDLDEDVERNTFAPEFCHQVFGDSESVFGYRDLKIRLFYTACRLIRYVNVSYTETIDVNRSEGVEPDDVIAIIKEKVGGTFISNLDTFAAALEQESNFTPFGDLLNVFTVDDKQVMKDGNEATVKRIFEIYKADPSDKGFLNYHEQMQTFLLWFIDAASYIDVDDDKWDFFVIYEKNVANGIPNGKDHSNSYPVYHFVGYMTVYRYYAYPENTRPRISQVLVLPPFQKKGIGVKLLETAYNHYRAQKSVVDITVEDPSDNFVRLRDFVDAKNCMKLNSYQPEMLARGWSEEMGTEAREKLKISKRQARRIYEILKLRMVDKSNPEEYRNYRLEIKNRLNAPFSKFKRFGLTASEKNMREMRYEELTMLYNQLEEDYQRVIERLAMHND